MSAFKGGCAERSKTEGGMNTFSTYDTGLAATLRYAGYELIETKKEGPHFRFVFNDSDGGITTIKLDFETGQQGVSNVTKLLAIHDEILKQIQQRATPVVEQHVVERHTGNEEYSIRSLGAAAFLRLSGFQLLRVEKSGQRSATFIFADDGSAKKFAEQYHKHQCSVDAKFFYESVKELRAQNRNAAEASPARTNEEAA